MKGCSPALRTTVVSEYDRFAVTLTHTALPSASGSVITIQRCSMSFPRFGIKKVSPQVSKGSAFLSEEGTFVRPLREPTIPLQ